MSIHKNSTDAYAALPLAKREREVLNVLATIGGSASDRYIAFRMGSMDPNYSRPRITGLLKRGILREAGHTVENGRRVRLVELTDESAWTLVP